MKEIVQKYINAYNNFDIEGMMSCMHTDCIFESRHNGELSFTTKGKHSFRQICSVAKNNYSFRKQIIEGFTSKGELLEVKFYFKGTLAIDLDEMGKKGEKIAFETKSIFEFKNGLIYKLINLD